MKAVIDRFEGDFAVLLAGEEEMKIDFPKSLLPEGAKEGMWLNLNIEIDMQETEKREEKISSLLEKIKNKNK